MPECSGKAFWTIERAEAATMRRVDDRRRRVSKLEKGKRVNKIDRDRVFISYSHEDRDWLKQLNKHLKPYVRAATISVWDDTRIPTGGKWREHISAALASARVGVLLVSPDYLDSDFIAEQELPPLLEAAQSGDLVIVWVPVSASAVHKTSIAGFQAAWNPETPLDSLSESEQNRALVRICDIIEQAFTRPHELTPPIGVDRHMPIRDVQCVPTVAMSRWPVG